MENNQSEGDVTSEVNGVTTSEGDVTKATRTTRLNVTDIEWLQEEGVDGESPAATLSRLREEMTGLRTANVEMFNGMKTMTEELKDANERLKDIHDEFKDPRSGSSTAVTTTEGQQTLGDFGSGAVRETMDTIKDVCDDETVCIKTALHMLDTKSAMVSKQLDRDHSADQKHLDREDKDKDRQLKLELADKKAQHERDMALIKKGVVKDADLEGVTFLGSMEKRKTAGERLADRKKRAYHAANGEDDDDFELVDDGETGYGEEDND